METKVCSKRNAKMGIYSLYTADTEEYVMSGTVDDLCEYLDVVKSCISHAVTRGSVVRRKYRIYYDGKDEEE